MENMQWLIGTIRRKFDAPLCVDSSNPDVLAAGLAQAGAGAILNSVSLEQGRLAPLVALAAERGCEVIALCMDDAGVPTGADDRVDRAGRLLERLADAGVGPERVIVDPCFFPVSSDPSAVRAVCDAIARIRALDAAVRVGGGVSNSSFGLPQRRWINHAVLTAAIVAGMNVGIVDPAAPGAMATIRAAEAASGADEYCGRYLAAYREGVLS
jgi:5-methyltetrahydrofolate--homocysteine methyltransferase